VFDEYKNPGSISHWGRKGALEVLKPAKAAFPFSSSIFLNISTCRAHDNKSALCVNSNANNGQAVLLFSE